MGAVLILDDEHSDADHLAERVAAVTEAVVVHSVEAALEHLLTGDPPALIAVNFQMAGRLDPAVVADFIAGHDWSEEQCPRVLAITADPESLPPGLRRQVDAFAGRDDMRTVRELVDIIARQSTEASPTPHVHAEPTRKGPPWKLVLYAVIVALFIPLLLLSLFIVRELGEGGGLAVSPTGSIEVQVAP